jgi:hypothetical protein
MFAVVRGSACAVDPASPGNITSGAWWLSRLWGSGNALLDDDEGLGYGTSGHETVAFLMNTVQFLTAMRNRLR